MIEIRILGLEAETGISHSVPELWQRHSGLDLWARCMHDLAFHLSAAVYLAIFGFINTIADPPVSLIAQEVLEGP